MKNKRHDCILEIIQEMAISTQEELQKELRKRGYEVTQATVSRDIRRLRLVKQQTADGRNVYAVSTVREDREREHRRLDRRRREKAEQRRRRRALYDDYEDDDYDDFDDDYDDYEDDYDDDEDDYEEVIPRRPGRAKRRR